MNSNISIGVVIVNYCRPNDTIDCIDSILQKNYFICDPIIILIDNGSNDNSYFVFQNTYKNDNRIVLKQIDHNAGYSGGFNKGIEIALSTNVDKILILNNDTLIEINAINILANNDYDIVLPKILTHDNPEIIWAAGAKWRKFPPGVIIKGYFKKDNLRYNIPGLIEYGTGCAIMIKREALLKIGGFDEDFGSYLEDFDFFYRAMHLNLKVFYEPKSIIYHKVSRTLGDYSNKKWFLLGRNAVLFYRKFNRFSYFTLINYVFWFIFRETIKGNAKLIPGFIHGVFKGFQYQKSKNKAMKNG